MVRAVSFKTKKLKSNKKLRRNIWVTTTARRWVFYTKPFGKKFSPGIAVGGSVV